VDYGDVQGSATVSVQDSVMTNQPENGLKEQYTELSRQPDAMMSCPRCYGTGSRLLEADYSIECACKMCHGSGFCDLGGMRIRCEKCDGTGVVRKPGFGGEKIYMECELCSGTGQLRDRHTALHTAARVGDAQALSVLIAAGADPCVEDRSGKTALHHAAKEGHLDIVRLIINGGGDPHTRDRNGETATTLAKLNGHKETAKLIRRHERRWWKFW